MGDRYVYYDTSEFVLCRCHLIRSIKTIQRLNPTVVHLLESTTTYNTGAATDSIELSQKESSHTAPIEQESVVIEKVVDTTISHDCSLISERSRKGAGGEGGTHLQT